MNAVVAPDAEGLFSVSEPLSFLLKLRAALASQLTWPETIISWHVLLFSTPSLFLPFTRKAYDALITTASQNRKIISQGYHNALSSIRRIWASESSLGLSIVFLLKCCQLLWSAYNYDRVACFDTGLQPGTRHQSTWPFQGHYHSPIT